MYKVLCGSSELFKNIKTHTPGDSDYIVFPVPDIIYEHTHPEENVCHFRWGENKEDVKKYLTIMPDYTMTAVILTKEYVDYYGYTKEEVINIINKYFDIYKTSRYRYYIPFFNYIKEHYSWEFPESVVKEAYEIYKKFKK